MKTVVVVALFSVAGGIWYWAGYSERVEHQAAVAALKDAGYRVRCGACGQTFDMPAAEYVSSVGSEGVKCSHCGKRKAWRVGNAEDVDPVEFRAEAERLTSVGEVKSATDAAWNEIRGIEKELAASEPSGDRARVARLRQDIGRLRAKIQALDLRWDALSTK